jgi:hypothetical protein
MAHRQLLTDEERQALLGIPLDADSMARFFTLSRADRHTEGAADAWIADDKRLTDHTTLWNLTGPVARHAARSQQIEAHCSAVARA